MKKVWINSEPVELYKILKMENLASSGGEAKFFISERKVMVNGETETRKRKKIVSGDVIKFAHYELSIKLVGAS